MEKIKTTNKLPKIVFIVGTTASGKSGLGILLAQKFNGEIISADSRQVYKGLDVGSGKVTKEEQAQVPHHLLDICDVGVRYSAADFQRDCYKKVDEILARGKNVFIVGGTGLYTRAVAEGFGFGTQGLTHSAQLRIDLEEKTVEELQQLIKDVGAVVTESDLQNKRRLSRAIELALGGGKRRQNEPKYNVLQIGLDWPKEILNKRIWTRLQQRLNNEDMVGEVKRLLDSGADPQFLISLGLEYRYITEYLQDRFESYDAFIEKLFTEIKRFAKRQRTWFKKEKKLVWLDMQSDFKKQAAELAQNFLCS